MAPTALPNYDTLGPAQNSATTTTTEDQKEPLEQQQLLEAGPSNVESSSHVRVDVDRQNKAANENTALLSKTHNNAKEDNEDTTEKEPPSSPARTRFQRQALLRGCVVLTVLLFVFFVIFIAVLYATLLPARLSRDYTDAPPPRFTYFEVTQVNDAGLLVTFDGSIDTYSDLHVRFYPDVHTLETTHPLNGVDYESNTTVSSLANWSPRQLLRLGMPAIVTSTTEYIPLKINNTAVQISVGDDREWLIKLLLDGVLGGKLKSNIELRLWSEVEAIIEEPWYKFGGFHWNKILVEAFLQLDMFDFENGGGIGSGGLGGISSILKLFDITIDSPRSTLSLIPKVVIDVVINLKNPFNFGATLGDLSLVIGIADTPLFNITVPKIYLAPKSVSPTSSLRVQAALIPALDLNLLLKLASGGPLVVSNVSLKYPNYGQSGVKTKNADGSEVISNPWVDDLFRNFSAKIDLPLSLPDAGSILNIINVISELVTGVTDILDLEIGDLSPTRVALLPNLALDFAINLENPTLVGFNLGNSSALVSANSVDLLSFQITPLALMPNNLNTGLTQTKLSIASLPGVPPIQAILQLLGARRAGKDIAFSAHNLNLGSDPQLNHAISNLSLTVNVPASGSINLEYALDVALDEIIAVFRPIVAVDLISLITLSSNVSIQLNNVYEYGIFLGNASLGLKYEGNDVLVANLRNLNLLPYANNTAYVDLVPFPDGEDYINDIIIRLSESEEINLSFCNISINNIGYPNDRLNALLAPLNLNLTIPGATESE